MLVAALNPCPCGYRNDPRRDCHCTTPQIERYMAKISGPLLDRIDIHIEVPAVQYRDLADGPAGTSSEVMRGQVTAARLAQTNRFPDSERTRRNAQLSHRQIRQVCKLAEDGENLLKSTMDELGLSARAHDKILRVARTIADLDTSARIQIAHLSEAINYRVLDRNMWT
ncbi:MAG: ATP-binding protein, partial [Pirellulales bacterium]